MSNNYTKSVVYSDIIFYQLNWYDYQIFESTLKILFKFNRQRYLKILDTIPVKTLGFKVHKKRLRLVGEALAGNCMPYKYFTWLELRPLR